MDWAFWELVWQGGEGGPIYEGLWSERYLEGEVGLLEG